MEKKQIGGAADKSQHQSYGGMQHGKNGGPNEAIEPQRFARQAESREDGDACDHLKHWPRTPRGAPLSYPTSWS